MIGLFDILTLASALSYLCGTILLALSVEFQADKLVLQGPLAKSVKEIGSPGRIERNKFKWGMILNGAGFSLLLVNTIFK